jgi:hypothetical protein
MKPDCKNPDCKGTLSVTRGWPSTAMQKLRIVILRFGTARQKMVLG